MPLLGTTGRKESIMKDIYSVAERNRIVEEQLCCIDKVLHRYRNLLQAARLEHDDLYQDLAIRLILAVGMVIFVASIVALLWALISKLMGSAQAGWTSLMASVWMIGGIQLLSLGVIGEYIGKVYNEAKARPRYIIERVLND